MYNTDFYKNLKKPPATPKSIVFQIVWPILYILMGVSFVMILKSQGYIKFYAILAFMIQLILNILWPSVFFIFKKMKLALFISIALFASVLWMILEFFKISKLASILQIPYLIWLLFASVLNYLFVKINKNNNNAL